MIVEHLWAYHIPHRIKKIQQQKIEIKTFIISFGFESKCLDKSARSSQLKKSLISLYSMKIQIKEKIKVELGFAELFIICIQQVNFNHFEGNKQSGLFSTDTREKIYLLCKFKIFLSAWRSRLESMLAMRGKNVKNVRPLRFIMNSWHTRKTKEWMRMRTEISFKHIKTSTHSTLAWWFNDLLLLLHWKCWILTEKNSCCF